MATRRALSTTDPDEPDSEDNLRTDRDDSGSDSESSSDGETGYIEDEEEEEEEFFSLTDMIQKITFANSFFFFWTNSEVICYLLFLLCFIIMAILGRTHDHYNYTQTQSLRTVLEQSLYHRDLSKDITDIDDIYDYIEQVVLPIVFKDQRANGTQIQNPLLKYYVNTYNARVLGGIRIKQNRLKRQECEVSPQTFPICYNEDGNQESDPFAGNGHWAQVPFNYYGATDLQDQPWTGKFGSYPGGGYVIDLLLSEGYENATLVLNEMRNGEWIDGGTMVLYIDFNAFDPSSLLHTVTRIAFEMPGGGIFASTEIKSWKFYRYKKGYGTTLSVFHLFFLIFIVGFTIQMGFQMYSEGVISLFAGDTMTSYWSKTHWRKLDVLNMILFYVLLGLFVSNDFYMKNLTRLTDIKEFYSFRRLQFLFLGEVYCQAFTGFFLILKALKFLRAFHGFRFFYAMFDASAPHLIVFFAILTIFFSSFAVLGFLFFASDLSDFRTFWLSVGNMIRYTVSDLNYNAVTQSSRLWGSFFWFGWTMLMILVLLNVFIGIITQAYNEALDIMDNEDEEDEIDKSAKVIDIIQKFGAARIDQLDDDGDGQISAKELAQVYPITLEEARAFIAHFDQDGDGELDQDEFQKLIEEQMQRKDEERKRKEQEEIEKKRKEREMRIQSARFAQKAVTKEEVESMKNQMKELQELLEAALNTTVDGSRAVKRVKGIEMQKK